MGPSRTPTSKYTKISFILWRRGGKFFLEKLLLYVGASANTGHIYGETALMRAAQNGPSQVAEVKSLTCFCCNHNTIHILTFFCVVYYSIRFTFDQTFFVLLNGKIWVSAGAVVDTADKCNQTAFMWASGNGHSQVTKVRILM